MLAADGGMARDLRSKPEGRGERESRPGPIDIHVGTRIQLQRILLGMSRERLGEAIGLTFQQVQKYERGVNRVGVSRLFDLSRVLNVPVSFFFGDLPDAPAAACGAQPSRRVERSGDDTLNRREALELVRAYYRVIDASQRKRVLELIKSMGAKG